MINMDVNHPDIEEFIDVKKDLSKVTSANISVNMTHEFMEAVKNDSEFELYFKVESTGEEIRKTIRARDLFCKLAESNHNMAEPGILFWDNIENNHLMSEDELFEYAGVNPCGEEPLPEFGSCNLSAINLAEFVINPFTENAKFDFDKFEEMVKHGVIYLNEILDYNMDNHPLEEQKEVSKNLRQIGLGIMGLADMFIKLGITYGSQESIDLSESIGYWMINSALQQSALLSKEYGAFPKYNQDAVLNSPYLQNVANDYTIELIGKYGLRNSQLLTIAPTGSTSTMLGVSGGLEPIFQLNYTRKTETLNGEDTYYKVFTPIVQEFMELHKHNNVGYLPNYFITSQEIPYRDRINVQSAWQKYIDASISSTVNLPNDTTVEEIKDLYIYAYDKGLKGITIYRDGCSRGGILISEPKPTNEEVEECST